MTGFTVLQPDTPGFFQRAVSGVDLHLVPYRDFVLEYPPAAYWALAVPRWLSDTMLPRGFFVSGRAVSLIPEYARAFHVEMLCCDVLAFGLLLVLLARRRRELLATTAWTYVVLTTLLGHVLLDRLDVGLLALLLVWAVAWLRLGDSGDAKRPAWSGGWHLLAYLALGLGVSYKLIPAALVPLIIVADIRTMRNLRDELRLGAALVALAIAAIGPFAWYYQLAGQKLWTMFAYHRARGLEIESLWSTLMLGLRPLGPTAWAEHGYGSWNIGGRLAAPLLIASTIAMAAILGLAMLRACWPTPRFSRVDGYRWCLLTLLALMTAAKVLSAQYLVWGLPAALLLGAEVLDRRRFLLLAGGLTLVAALTTCVFPYLFFDEPLQLGHALVPELDWLPVSLLFARNALLVAITGWLAAALLRREDAEVTAGS